MSPTLTSSASLPRRRVRRRLSLKRLMAWVAASATNRNTASAFVFTFAVIHALLWTVILINLKAAQDIHMDVAEAFAWGQKFQFGYGKHPPLSGWVAGLWFKAFPVTDWSTYLLAMTTVSCGLVINWLIALRVVDYRRAFFVVVMLAIYPIFNFKGFKYNPDLLQLVTLPLLVLAYLNAFEKRTALSGVWLGLAAALALMTKYWVLTMIGAVGLAALVHPDRMRLLRSPAPWIAMVVATLAMIPHLIWLKDVDFAPLIYAGDVYGHFTRAQTAILVLGYIEHCVGLLILPGVVAVLALVGVAFRKPSAAWQRIWSSGANPGVNTAQALNIWLIQIIVAVGPPLGGLIFSFYMKTDWGISLFFLAPLALVAIPQLRVPSAALFRIATAWLVLTLATLAASPYIALHEFNDKPSSAFAYSARSVLARDLTQMWHSRFFTRWSVVAGTTEVGEPVTFYSPDHPAPLTPGEVWSSGLTSLDEAKRLGFIGICDTADNRLPECEAWMVKNGKDAEQVVVSAPRYFKGHAGPATTWKVYIVPPAR